MSAPTLFIGKYHYLMCDNNIIQTDMFYVVQLKSKQLKGGKGWGEGLELNLWLEKDIQATLRQKIFL